MTSQKRSSRRMWPTAAEQSIVSWELPSPTFDERQARRPRALWMVARVSLLMLAFSGLAYWWLAPIITPRQAAISLAVAIFCYPLIAAFAVAMHYATLLIPSQRRLSKSVRITPLRIEIGADSQRWISWKRIESYEFIPPNTLRLYLHTRQIRNIPLPRDDTKHSILEHLKTLAKEATPAWLNLPTPSRKLLMILASVSFVAGIAAVPLIKVINLSLITWLPVFAMALGPGTWVAIPTRWRSTADNILLACAGNLACTAGFFLAALVLMTANLRQH